jgi:hypothetical protein
MELNRAVSIGKVEESGLHDKFGQTQACNCHQGLRQGPHGVPAGMSRVYLKLRTRKICRQEGCNSTDKSMRLTILVETDSSGVLAEAPAAGIERVLADNADLRRAHAALAGALAVALGVRAPYVRVAHDEAQEDVGREGSRRDAKRVAVKWYGHRKNFCRSIVSNYWENRCALIVPRGRRPEAENMLTSRTSRIV